MIKKYILSIKKQKFIFLSIALPLFYTLIGSAIAFIFFKDDIDPSNKLQNLGLLKKIFYGVLLAPFVETLFFQFLPVEFLRLITKNKDIFIVFVSGTLFGMAHFFNNHDYFFSIAAFFIGYYLLLSIFLLKNVKILPFLFYWFFVSIRLLI